MSAQGRIGDLAQNKLDAHGCPGCPHQVVGPGIVGSPDTLVNGLPALRVDDEGIHAPCCGANKWKAIYGSQTVYINGKPAHRVDDKTQHCGGIGQLTTGSPNVNVGGASVGGSGSGGSGGGGSGGGGGGGPGSGGGGGTGSGGGGGSGSGGGGGGGGGGGTGSGSGSGSGSGTGTGSTDAPPAGANSGDTSDPPIDPHEIHIQLTDARGNPVTRAYRYELTLPDGSVRTGSTKPDGSLDLTDLTQQGNCTLRLPDFEPDAPPEMTA